MISKRYLSLSVLAHGLALALVLLPDIQKPPKNTVEFTLAENSQKSGSQKHTKARAKSNRASTKHFDFGISTTRAVMQTFIAESKRTERGEMPTEIAAKDQFDPYGGLEMPEIRFIQSLWREIDKAIVSPPYLSEYGHTGTVLLAFDIDTDGSLHENSFRVSAEDRVLKVIAARAIRKAILNEKGELPKPRELTRVFTSFTWASYQACAGMSGTGKNTLKFCNYAEDKRKTFSTGEGVATYLSALKYGLGAAEAIKKYNQEKMRRNTQFNPFQEFERDPDWDLGG